MGRGWDGTLGDSIGCDVWGSDVVLGRVGGDGEQEMEWVPQCPSRRRG